MSPLALLGIASASGTRPIPNLVVPPRVDGLFSATPHRDPH